MLEFSRMLKETAQYLEQYTQDADVAKAALARITQESIMAWITVYGDSSTVETADSSPSVKNFLQTETLIKPKFLIDVEPLPESYRPGKQLPYQIVRASRTGYMGLTDGRRTWRAVDLSTVEVLALKNAGYSIRFFENFPDGPYGGLKDLTVVTASDSDTKNKVDQIRNTKITKNYPHHNLNEMIEIYTFERCLRIYTEGLQSLLKDHPTLKP